MNSLPKNVLKFFWGDRLEELDWNKHKNFIAKTILEKGDREAARWLLEKTDKEFLKTIIKEKGLDSKSKNFWNIYLS
jgi:hypothetical protein